MSFKFIERDAIIEPTVRVEDITIGTHFLTTRKGHRNEVIYTPIDLNALHVNYPPSWDWNKIPCVNIGSGQIRMFDADAKVFLVENIEVTYTRVTK